MSASLTTDEMLRPVIEAPTGKCHWWSSRVHCWHDRDCDHQSTVDCLHRKCCWCGRHEYTQLRVAHVGGHGKYYDVPEDERTMIWTSWGERSYMSDGWIP